MKIGIIFCGVNILFDAILVGPLEQGGLALATSLVGMLGCVILLRSLIEKIGTLDLCILLSALVKVSLASLTMCLIMSTSSIYLEGSKQYLGQTAIFALEFCAGIGSFLLACYILKIEEYKEVVQYIERKIFSKKITTRG
jgi:putative peptidoglycan lipid II flippase